MNPATFVVSTGRTGTRFLATTFGELGARAHHEPGPWWLRHLSNAHASHSISSARAVRRLHRVRDADVRGEGPDAAPWFEASCLIYGLVGPLLEAYPDARVVQVVRDPRSYVRSGLDWGAYRFGGRPLNLAPFRRLAPPQFDRWRPAARVDWARRDQFARLCWAWSAMNRSMRTQGAGADRFRTVRFEDLTDTETGPATLGGIADDLDLEVDPARLREAVGHRVNASRPGGGGWRTWSTDRLETLLDHTAAEAAEYGYPVAAEVAAELTTRR